MVRNTYIDISIPYLHRYTHTHIMFTNHFIIKNKPFGDSIFMFKCIPTIFKILITKRKNVLPPDLVKSRTLDIWW